MWYKSKTACLSVTIVFVFHLLIDERFPTHVLGGLVPYQAFLLTSYEEHGDKYGF